MPWLDGREKRLYHCTAAAPRHKPAQYRHVGHVQHQQQQKQFDREKVVTAELDDGVPIREVGVVDQEAHRHRGGSDDTGTQRCEAAGGRLREEKRKRRAREGAGHGVTWLTGQPESCRAGWNGSR
jgi:hypothetical protein